jgi:acetyltransferase
MLIRPITPGDGDAFQAFVQGMSVESRTNRFLFPVRELSPASLQALTHADQQRHVGLVALAGEHIVGEGRYVVLEDSGKAEFALAVADERQRKGIGTRLLQALIDTARRAQLVALEGDILRSNRAMLQFLRKQGFEMRNCVGDARVLLAEKLLEGDDRTNRRSRMHQLESLVYPV